MKYVYMNKTFKANLWELMYIISTLPHKSYNVEKSGIYCKDVIIQIIPGSMTGINHQLAREFLYQINQKSLI